MAQLQRSDDLETTLLWIVTGYRVFAAVWLSILGLVVLSSDTTPVANPPVVAATVGLVVAWAATATTAAIVKPHVASTWWFVAADLAVSAWTVAAGTVAITIQFAGGYPLAGAFGAIYAFGTAGGAVGAATLTATGLFPLLKNESQSFSQDVANAIAFLFSVGAAIGVAGALRASDQRRAEAEEALATERTERTRAEEHAEVAAHLHDSVLQTLALIQRDPASTPDIRGLARHQERELRTWLFPNLDTASPSGAFREALVDVCSEVEDMGGAQVEVVVVGNSSDSVDPIVRAAREAILNARNHAGVELVSVYGEANTDEVLVFVKDRGKGFEPTAVDDSRHGIRESIVGRMERHGGSAEIISVVGSGTEVRLRLPLGD
jgi:signal transduction histidine kinase